MLIVVEGCVEVLTRFCGLTALIPRLGGLGVRA